MFAVKEIIAINPKAPNLIKGVEHTIPFTPGMKVRPHKARLRRLSPVERAAHDKETEVLVKNGLVRPSTSPWAAGTVLVPKKDGGLRYAIHYRRLNSCTYTDSMPLPRCDDVIDAVNGSFSTALEGELGAMRSVTVERQARRRGAATRRSSARPPPLPPPLPKRTLPKSRACMQSNSE